jgi:hypothetical protein
MRVLRLLTAVSLIVLPVLAARPASAAPVDLVCPSSATLNFTPGVTLGSQTLQITGVLDLGTSVSPLTPCSSVLTGVPFTGGTGVFSGTGTFGCITLGLFGITGGGAQGTVAVTWNDGTKSTITFSLTLSGPVPLVSASVTSGELEGSTVIVAPFPVGLTGNCIFAPLTSISVAAVTAFVQL